MRRGRTAYLVMGLAIVLALLLSGAAQAVTLQGGDSAHRSAVLGTLQSQPRLLAAVESVYPGFCVRLNYGGMAWPGYIDVSVSLWGKAFTNQVCHEFCHELQIAADAPGGYESLTTAWRQWMRVNKPQVDTSRWDGFIWNHTLMEALRQAFYAPYYAGGPEYRVYADRGQVTALLQSVGIQP